MTVQQIKPIVPSRIAWLHKFPAPGSSIWRKTSGKAIALKTGAAAAKSEYLVCIDGDALLDRDAAYIMGTDVVQPACGVAVTGNRIRTRSTTGWVKFRGWRVFLNYWFDQTRTQRIYGNVFTVSVLLPHFVAAPTAKK